jgi:hypothetical protein
LGRGLVSQEDNQYQYRFRDIIDLASGRPLFTCNADLPRITDCSGETLITAPGRPNASRRARARAMAASPSDRTM